MITQTIRTLRETNKRTELTEVAKGRYKYPSNWNEFKNALKWLLRKK
ncbi:hypothetical protein B617_gp48 [Nonlabens phage P12024S]|uniref:Uncharacterized protein n=1 Tax=Nonlabens phage P12024S TaxID=1168478 RepID=I6R9N5_9CAUD|nr:hypothetical protein B617_gp48 [Nonlabens phage P12024S]AFM54709.1 hypothetical protein P12024S_48 [Nonlabens phage P12024S]